MANTENIEAKLCAYVDGELDAAGRAEIEAHLAGNPQHHQLMTELTAQRDLLRGLPRAKAPDDLLESVHNTLERSVLLDGAGAAQDEEAHVAGRINPWPRVFGIAAVLVLGIGLAAMIFLILPKQKSGDFAITTAPPSASTLPSTIDGFTAAAGADRDRSARGGGGAPHRADESPIVGGKLDGVGGGASTGATSNDEIVARRSGDAIARASEAAKAAAPAPGESPVASKTAASNIFDQKGGGIADNVASNVAEGGRFGQQLFNSIPAIDPSVVEAHLRQAPGAVPDNSMLVVVAANDPSLANRRVQEFLTSNAIRWEEVPEPMPQPLRAEERQRVLASRAQNTQVRLKEGPPTDDQLQLKQQSGQVMQAPAPPEGVASNESFTLDRSAGEAKAGPADASSRPPMSKGGYEPPAAAAQESKSADVSPAPSAPNSPSPDPAAAAAAAGPAADAVAKSDSAAAPDFAKKFEDSPAAQGERQPEPGRQASAAQQRRRPEEPGSANQLERQEIPQAPAVQQQAAPPAPTPDDAQKDKEAPRQQAGPVAPGAPSDIASAATVPTLQTPDGPVAGPASYGAQQVLVARGLTRQQVAELYACVRDQNAGRVANYHRNGANYTPATLPAVSVFAMRDNLHLQKSATNTSGSGAAAVAAPASTSPAAAAPPTTAPAGSAPAGAFGPGFAETDPAPFKRNESTDSTSSVATPQPAQPAPAPSSPAPAAEPSATRAFTGGTTAATPRSGTPQPATPGSATPAPATSPAPGEPHGALAGTRDDDEAAVQSPAPPPSGPVTYPPESAIAEAPAATTQPAGTAGAGGAGAAAATQPSVIAGAAAPTHDSNSRAAAAATTATTQPAEPRLDVVIVLQSDAAAIQQQSVDDQIAPNATAAPDVPPPAEAPPLLAPNAAPLDVTAPTTTPAAQ